MSVEDGLRKLKLLDAKGKVWTQDMVLQVDEKAVSLVDADTKVTVMLTCGSLTITPEMKLIN